MKNNKRNLRVLACLDSFKGSLSSPEAGEAVRAGVTEAVPDAEVIVKTLADGGEGTVRALCREEELRIVKAHDPLGREIDAVYGVITHGGHRTAVIETASAAGLTLLSDSERDPMVASTYGLGEVIRAAIGDGIRDFVIGLGGSATNDGGIGMLSALGFGFLNRDRKPVSSGAKGLSELETIDVSGVMPELCECRFRAACDVDNPLCGEDGCSAVFAPQKGARDADIPVMDEWLGRFAGLSRDVFPDADPEFPGSGAAGGLGFAVRTFLRGELVPGAGLIIDATGLENAVRNADIVVTGEGRLDAQSAMGKGPTAVSSLARKHGKPCVAFAGCIGDGAEKCRELGIDAYFPIQRGAVCLEEAMKPENARRNLSSAVCEVFRLIDLFG